MRGKRWTAGGRSVFFAGGRPIGRGISYVDSWAMHPPFSFRSCRKENGPCTVQKKRTPLVALRRLRASALYGGRREMVPAGLRGLSDGRGGVRYRLDGRFPRRGCRQQRAARTHLTSFSFRAFRFATRYPGGRGGLYQRADVGIRPYGRTMAFRVPVGADALIGPLHQLPCGTASGSEKLRRVYPRLPRAQSHPKGNAFPSLTTARDRQPSPAGGRRAALAQTDPP